MTLPVTPRHTITYLGPSWKIKYHHLGKVAESITETTVHLKAIKNQQYVRNRTWKRHSCWEGGEKKEEKHHQRREKVLMQVRWKKGGNAKQTHRHRQTIADKEQRVNLPLTPLASWNVHSFYNKKKLNNYFCLSNTLLFHCLLLCFHEKPVTNVIAYQW